MSLGRRHRHTAYALALLIALGAVGTATAVRHTPPRSTVRTTTTTVDAVAQAQLILQGPATRTYYGNALVGSAIASVNDMTGDGRPDLILGAPNESLPGRPQAGVVYVVFDTPRTGSVSLDDPRLDGFRIIGGPYYRAGTEVAAAGDVNGDGRPDIILTAPRHGVTCPSPLSGPCGYGTPGVAFVIYGKAGGGTVDLAHLRPSQGFEIKGVPSQQQVGLAGLGDIAHDGFSAIAVAGATYSGHGMHYEGGAYVIYGSHHPQDVDLQRPLGPRGFRVASAGGDVPSPLVAAGGDVNGDGRPDLLLSVPAEPPSIGGGAVVVLFGGHYQGTIDWDHLGPDGFRIVDSRSRSIGNAPLVAGVGDLRRDHHADVLLVRSTCPPAPNTIPEADIVFGSALTRTVDLAHLGTRGVRIFVQNRPSYTCLGPVAGLGDASAGIVSTTTLPLSPFGMESYDTSVSVLFGSRLPSTISLDDLGSAGVQFTEPMPTGSCNAPGPGNGRLSALGDVSGTGQTEFAIGAPALGVNAGGGCPGGEVLIETLPG
jgi:hypothetical protein